MKHWIPDDPWDSPRRHEEMADRLSRLREQNLLMVRRMAFGLAVAIMMILLAFGVGP